MLCVAECGADALFYANDGNVILPLCEDCGANAEVQGYETLHFPFPKATQER